MGWSSYSEDIQKFRDELYQLRTILSELPAERSLPYSLIDTETRFKDLEKLLISFEKKIEGLSERSTNPEIVQAQEKESASKEIERLISDNKSIRKAAERKDYKMNMQIDSLKNEIKSREKELKNTRTKLHLLEISNSTNNQSYKEILQQALRLPEKQRYPLATLMNENRKLQKRIECLESVVKATERHLASGKLSDAPTQKTPS